MLPKIHLEQIWETRPLIMVLLIGIGVFWADYSELSSPLIRELVLVALSLAKSVWFVSFVIRRIRLSTQFEFYFHEFMIFIGMSIVLFIISYAIDFYCLYQINPDSFHGLTQPANLANDFLSFFYYSVTTFTTAGLGDIVPASASARLFTSAELIISFFFTIFIIANLAILRESFSQKKNGKDLGRKDQQ
ncbi:MAG: two pore domain potassium channel family protein [Saprospiraceae bacterium]|nr:two pore domain potassium channel family protein [Saprospiraceae bacterium]